MQRPCSERGTTPQPTRRRRLLEVRVHDRQRAEAHLVEGVLAEADLDRPAPERFPEFARARAFETELGPGDVLYWPSFWAHHIRNQDAFTLAVSVTVEELRANAMQLRETLGVLSRLFLRMAGDPSRGFDLTNRAGVLTALRALESELFTEENRKRTSMWSWHNSIWHG